jgi:hypothetical protein
MVWFVAKYSEYFFLPRNMLSETCGGNLNTASLTSDAAPVLSRIWAEIPEFSNSMCADAHMSMLAHASKYPYAAVSGVLLGDGEVVRMRSFIYI